MPSLGLEMSSKVWVEPSKVAEMLSDVRAVSSEVPEVPSKVKEVLSEVNLVLFMIKEPSCRVVRTYPFVWGAWAKVVLLLSSD